MNEIIAYLTEKYHPSAMIVYGSFADGSHNENSDFDALLIADCPDRFHDVSFFRGTQMDVFVYPENAFNEAFHYEELLQISDGIIVLDRNGLAAKIREHVRKMISSRSAKTEAEIADELSWCRKMLLRAERQDAEGLFRLHWLLTDSLEIFCDVTKLPYAGPKKTLRMMEKQYPDAFSVYSRALLESTAETAGKWIDHIEILIRQPVPYKSNTNR